MRPSVDNSHAQLLNQLVPSELIKYMLLDLSFEDIRCFYNYVILIVSQNHSVNPPLWCKQWVNFSLQFFVSINGKNNSMPGQGTLQGFVRSLLRRTPNNKEVNFTLSPVLYFRLNIISYHQSPNITVINWWMNPKGNNNARGCCIYFAVARSWTFPASEFSPIEAQLNSDGQQQFKTS